jgi:hypothetical protein
MCSDRTLINFKDRTVFGAIMMGGLIRVDDRVDKQIQSQVSRAGLTVAQSLKNCWSLALWWLSISMRRGPGPSTFPSTSTPVIMLNMGLVISLLLVLITREGTKPERRNRTVFTNLDKAMELDS